MHVRMRANRKGVDNLCNCIQTLCPSLYVSSSNFYTVIQRMNWYSLDAIAMMMISFIIKYIILLGVQREFHCGFSARAREAHTTNQIVLQSSYLRWSKKNRKIPHLAHQMVASLCCITIIIIVALNRYFFVALDVPFSSSCFCCDIQHSDALSKSIYYTLWWVLSKSE